MEKHALTQWEKEKWITYCRQIQQQQTSKNSVYPVRDPRANKPLKHQYRNDNYTFVQPSPGLVISVTLMNEDKQARTTWSKIRSRVAVAD